MQVFLEKKVIGLRSEVIGKEKKVTGLRSEVELGRGRSVPFKLRGAPDRPET
jgi:hypothetical protein